MKFVNIRAGDTVEVKSKVEILATLDKNGNLENLPFMQEMLQFSGKRFTVFKSAHKTCDTINKTGLRSMHDAVHLDDVRCDGKSHGGCEAKCLIFWKKEWLKRVDEELGNGEKPINRSGCTESELLKATKKVDDETKEEIFTCQATELFKATSKIAWWDFRHYITDILTKNITVWDFFRVYTYSIFAKLIHLGFGYRFLLRFYNKIKHIFGGWEYPHLQGSLKKTPKLSLNLQVGDIVKVKRYEDILSTLDINNKNRGLFFDAEMVRYCEDTRKVLNKVAKIIDEKTGKMLKLPNDCLILDGVVCSGELSQGRLFCPRCIYPYWREIWLEKVETKISNP